MDFGKLLGTTDIYDHNRTKITREGHFIRVVNNTSVRISGFESRTQEKKNKPCSVNDYKLENNLIRAKSMIRQYARCNDWDFFCTFTLNAEKHDRYDLKSFIKKFTKFLNNYNNRNLPPDCKVQYLFIPEQHKDGAWHLHGLLKGIADADLYENQYGYLSWRQYEKAFGFISLSRIKDIDACSLYIMKYISKDFGRNNREKGNSLYYHSQGLKTAELIAQGTNLFLKCDYDYQDQNGFFRVKTFDCNSIDYRDYIGGLNNDDK